MEKEGIKKLERRKNKNYHEDPLLEYVVRVLCGDEISPSSLMLVIQFFRYYQKGDIDTSMEGLYVACEDVQRTLQAFGLDRDKFWYLCLMVKDVVRGYSENTFRKERTPRQELEELVNTLQGIDPIYDEQLKLFHTFKNKGSLVLKVDKGKNKGSNSLTIKNGKTLFYLSKAVNQFLEKNPEPEHFDNDIDNVSSCDINQKRNSEAEIWQVALFHNIIDRFLIQHLKGKTVKRRLIKAIEVQSFTGNSLTGKRYYRNEVTKVDTDRMHLISKLIYIFDISDKEDYIKPEKNFLKNRLRRKYKDLNPLNYNSRYPGL